jgi:hypothetical protein
MHVVAARAAAKAVAARGVRALLEPRALRGSVRAARDVRELVGKQLQSLG